MTPNPSIDAVSTYRLTAGSPRVRIADWLAHEGLTATWHTYAGTAARAPCMERCRRPWCS